MHISQHKLLKISFNFRSSQLEQWQKLQKVEQGPDEHSGSKLCEKGLQLKSPAMEGGHCND